MTTSFGAKMRALMAERGLSLGKLGKVIHYDAGHLSKVSRDLKRPSAELAGRLDKALDADGALSALACPLGDLHPDDEERLLGAIRRPVRVDRKVVDTLTTILAAQRRLDDSLGPEMVLPAAAAQASTAVRLLCEARGSVRGALGPVAAEWVQFHGWLRAEIRDDATAVRLLTDAEMLADDFGDGVLAAQAENFKGYLARQQGRPRGVIRHFMAAYTTPGASAPQRLGDVVQAAHGYALVGDGTTARRLLAEAETLEDQAAREVAPGTAYWLSPTFQHINVGLALAGLGEHADAAEHLAAGLESLPSDQRNAEWTGEYRAALVRARELA